MQTTECLRQLSSGVAAATTTLTEITDNVLARLLSRNQSQANPDLVKEISSHSFTHTQTW